MIRPFGEFAYLVELDGPLHAQALAASLRNDPLPGVTVTVPGLSSLLVEVDRAATTDVRDVVAELRRRVAKEPVEPLRGRVRTIPVVYGGDRGPDLGAVAARCGLTPEAFVARHARLELRVLFCGFAPGFAYLGDMPPEMHVPRLAKPRTRTPAGSVAVAGSMTGVYPAELPGGWHVIGGTPVRLFDPLRDPPVYLAPGDVVRFEPIAADAWSEHASTPDAWG